VTPSASGLIDSTSFVSPTSVTANQNNWWLAFGRDSQNGLVRFEVDWGDGSRNTYNTLSGVRDRFENKAYHVYRVAGNYTINITASGSDGTTESKSLGVEVLAESISDSLITFGIPSGSRVVPIGVESAWQISAFDQSHGEGVRSLIYNIDWGDGTTSEYTGLSRNDPVTAVHTYSTVGVYRVTVNFSNLIGATASTNFQVEAYDPSAQSPFSVGSEVWVVDELTEIMENKIGTSAPYEETMGDAVIGQKKLGTAGILASDKIGYKDGRWVLVDFYGTGKAWVKESSIMTYGTGIITQAPLNNNRFGLNETVNIVPVTFDSGAADAGRHFYVWSEVKERFDPNIGIDRDTGNKKGIVIGGPVVLETCDGPSGPCGQKHEFWKIRWGSGLEGWSFSKWLYSDQNKPQLLDGWISGSPRWGGNTRPLDVYGRPTGNYLAQKGVGTGGELKAVVYNFLDKAWWWYAIWHGPAGTSVDRGWSKEYEILNGSPVREEGGPTIGNPGNTGNFGPPNIINPSATTVWRLGQTATINWTMPQEVTGVHLYLVGVGVVALNVPNTGSYSWTIPTQLNSVTLGGSYLMYIYSADIGTSYFDVSDFFTIQPN